MIKIMIATLALMATSAVSWGSQKYREIDGCGSAEVLSGDTCSNVKVRFHFQGCQIKSDPQPATRIVCEKSRIKARYDEGDYRLEALFDKQDDGWGGVLWVPEGAVRQLNKLNRTASHGEMREAMSARAVATVSKVPVVKGSAVENPAAVAPEKKSTVTKKPEARNPATKDPVAKDSGANGSASKESAPKERSAGSAAPAESNQSPADSRAVAGVHSAGYVDFRYTDFKTYEDPNIPNGGAHESGFGLEEGAFFLSYEKDGLSAVLDLAFRRAKDVDTNAAATTPNQSSNGNLGVGVDHSQLYLKYKISESFILDIGQFDTIFGVELNDSKDRIFGKTGLVYDYTLPVTHTGLMVEFVTGAVTTKIFAANPNNKGSFGTSTSGDEKAEYGGALSYAGSVLRGQVGLMGRPIQKASALGNGNRLLMDFLLGATLGKLSLDLELSRINDPSKNTLTNSDSSDEESAGLGFLALASYQVSDSVLFGLRYEQIQNDPAGNLSVHRASSLGESIHIKMRNEIEFRAEFVDMRFSGAGVQDGVAWHDTRFSSGVLFKLP